MDDDYSFFRKPGSFEEGQIAKERAAEFEALVAEKLAALGDDAEIEEVAAAINAASREMDPEIDELKYVMDGDENEEF